MSAIESLRASYKRLPAREQRWLLAGSGALILFLTYTLIVAPAVNDIRRASAEIRHERKLDLWIKRETPTLMAHRAPSHQSASPQMIDRALRTLAHTLPAPRGRIHLRETHPGAWTLKIDGAPYAPVLSILLPFIADHHLSIRRLVVHRSAHKPATVNIDLGLRSHAQTS